MPKEKKRGDSQGFDGVRGEQTAKRIAHWSKNAVQESWRKWQVEKRAVFLEPALLIKGPLVSMGHLSPHQRLCLITDTVQYTNNTTHHHPPPTHPPTDGGDVRFGVSSTSEPSQKKPYRSSIHAVFFDFFFWRLRGFVCFVRASAPVPHPIPPRGKCVDDVRQRDAFGFFLCVCVGACVCVCVCQWLTEDISKPVTPNQQRGGTV